MPMTGLLLSGCGKTIPIKNLPPQNGQVCCFGDNLLFGTGSSNAEENLSSVPEQYDE